jgi:hypothetical protein
MEQQKLSERGDRIPELETLTISKYQMEKDRLQKVRIENLHKAREIKRMQNVRRKEKNPFVIAATLERPHAQDISTTQSSGDQNSSTSITQEGDSDTAFYPLLYSTSRSILLTLVELGSSYAVGYLLAWGLSSLSIALRSRNATCEDPQFDSGYRTQFYASDETSDDEEY